MSDWRLTAMTKLWINGLSLTAVAVELGVSPQYISAVMKGKEATESQRERIEDAIERLIERRQ